MKTKVAGTGQQGVPLLLAPLFKRWPDYQKDTARESSGSIEKVTG